MVDRDSGTIFVRWSPGRFASEPVEEPSMQRERSSPRFLRHLCTRARRWRATRRGLRRALENRVVSQDARYGETLEQRCAARCHVARVDGAGVHRDRPVAAFSQQRYGESGRCDATRHSRRTISSTGDSRKRPRRAAAATLARPAARHAEPHADHPSRLRRGLECDRQVEGHAACRSARPLGQPEARYVIFHCADPMAGAARITTRASTWRTPFIRRRFSRTS